MTISETSNPDEPLATLAVEDHGHGVYVTVQGEIDMSNARTVVSSLLATAEGQTGLVLDIRRVGYLDSHTIARLHQLWQELSAAGQGLLIITGRNTAAERTLRMSGMDQVLPLDPDGPRDPGSASTTG